MEKARRTPVSGDYDAAVAGAGVAGAAAAVSAARAGAKVCLIEKETAPGGLATLGLIAIYLPLCDGMGNKVISGIPEELLKISIKYGPGEIPACWKKKSSREERKNHRYRVNFNPYSFVISLEEYLLENNVQILYDSRVCGCIMDRKKIKALIIENKDGRSAVSAKTFVDATGDADICRAAGERTVALDTNKKAEWYQLYNDGEIISRKLGGPSDRKPRPREKTFSGVSARDVTEFSIESRRMALRDLKERTREFSRIYPATLPSVPQFRMTRRLKGLYELDEKEERKYFDDAVCMTGDWRKPGPVFHIPYRCLIGRTENLFAAGRCISVMESMWDITRAIPTCAATGEAAGKAAALCAAGRVRAEDISFKLLKDALMKSGVIIKHELAEN